MSTASADAVNGVGDVPIAGPTTSSSAANKTLDRILTADLPLARAPEPEATGPRPRYAKRPEADDEGVKTIRQTVTIHGAKPRDVYDALTETGRHSYFTGAKARIGNSVGDPWRAYDGSLSGKQIELVPGKRIVQTWRGHDWPAGHYSTVSFTLSRVPGGTRIDLRQTGVPDEHYQSYRKGWTDFYWVPLKRLFAG